MTTIHGILSRAWLTLLGTAAALISFAVPAASQALEYDRALVAQPWRFVTCHFAHFDANHLLWSGSVFVALSLWLEARSRKRLALCWILSAIAVSVAVHAGTSFATYRGLSGIDSALFACLVVTLWREARARNDRTLSWVAVASGLGFAAKLLFEFVTTEAVFVTASGYDAVPIAHLVGAIAGAWVSRRQTTETSNPAPSCAEASTRLRTSHRQAAYRTPSVARSIDPSDDSAPRRDRLGSRRGRSPGS